MGVLDPDYDTSAYMSALMVEWINEQRERMRQMKELKFYKLMLWALLVLNTATYVMAYHFPMDRKPIGKYKVGFLLEDLDTSNPEHQEVLKQNEQTK